MKTETLLLLRTLGRATPQELVQWGVDQLSAGTDSPSLRILAGLQVRTEAAEAEDWFVRACGELGIREGAGIGSCRDAAGLVHNAFASGECAAREAIALMADLYERSGSADPLLSIWDAIEMELQYSDSADEGCFYAREGLDDLGPVVEREWALFMRGVRLDLPADFMAFLRCEACGYIGPSRLVHRSGWDRLRAALAFVGVRPPLHPVCSACASGKGRIMIDPDVRDEYFRRLEARSAG